MARVRDVILGAVSCWAVLVVFGAIPTPWDKPPKPPIAVFAYPPATRIGDKAKEIRSKILRQEEVNEDKSQADIAAQQGSCAEWKTGSQEHDLCMDGFDPSRVISFKTSVNK